MKQSSPYLKYLGISFVLYFLLFILSPRSGHPYDMQCWLDWANYVYEKGLGLIYNSYTDYLPLFHYVLKAFVSCQDSLDDVRANIHYLKAVSLIFHFITGYFIFRLIRSDRDSREATFLNTLFYLLNIAVLYNAVIWGQVDIILTCLVFMSCYFALRHQVLAALVLLLLALNFKLHAIIFVPVVGLLLLPEMIRTFSFKKLFTWLLVLGAIEYLIVLPFYLAGTMDHLIGVVSGSVGKFPVISANAFNLWYLLVPGKLDNMSDAVVAYGLSYKNWGLLLFCVFSFFALLPLLKWAYGAIRTHTQASPSKDQMLLVCALIPILFFYFNTQMHERYAHPALAFLITYCILHKKPLPAITGCLAYFLNLEAVLKFLQLPKYSTLIFDERFISGLWLLTLLSLFAELYRIRLPGFFRREKAAVIS